MADTGDPAAILGRDVEVECLALLVTDVSRLSRVALVEGQAGIGKTTLVEKAIALARDHGHALLVCRPVRSERDLAFVGLMELLAGVDEDVADELPAPQRRAFDIVLRRIEPDGPLDQLSLSVMLLTAVRELAAKRGLLIAIDDLQWLDRPTAKVLAYVLRRIEDTGAHVVIAQRGSGDRSWPFGLDLALPNECLTSLLLGPLSASDLAQMLRSKFGWAPPWPTIHRIAEISGGNPFYAREIGRAWAEGSGDSGLEEVLPGRLLDLVRSRLDSLPPPARDLLDLVSVPQRPTAEVLRRLAQAMAGPAKPLDISETLALAEKSGVLVTDGMRVRFSHPIIAAAVYGSLSPQRRTDMHRAMATLTEDVEERARHHAIATPGPDVEGAALLEAAAESSWRRGAPDASAHLLRAACRMTTADETSDLARRRIALGRMLFHAGDQLAAMAELDAQQSALPSGSGRARALYHLMYVARSATGIERAVEYGEQAVLESVDDPAFQAEVLEHLSRVADHDSALKLDMARRAMRAMSQVTEPNPVALFYVRAALVEAEFHAGLGIHLELLANPPPEGPPGFPPVRTASSGDDLTGRLLAMSGRVDEGRTVLRKLYDRAATENLSIIPAVLCWMSELEVIAGRFVSACSLSEEALRRAEETGAAANLAWVLGRHAVALSYLGRLDDAEDAAMRALTLAQSDPKVGVEETVARLALGAVQMARNRYEAAAQHLRVIDGIARRAGIRDPRWFWHSADLVEALIAAGDLEEAAETLAEFEEQAERSGGQWTLAASARCRSLLCAAEGQLDAAMESAESSLAKIESLPMPFERARTLLVKGQIHRRRREKKAADLALRQAVDAFEQLETPVWAQRARAEQRRIGLRPHATQDLTETEQRVALLAATGMTNREVATAMFMATKTVESALARVYRKLGIESRAELGAWAARTIGPAEGSNTRPRVGRGETDQGFPPYP
ncbi:MAG: hypothetical protein QOI06_1522 [Nocardioidaceae bacterium]|nr:hypothetical protein [Nocardioidaceae bacterium]